MLGFEFVTLMQEPESNESVLNFGSNAYTVGFGTVTILLDFVSITLLLGSGLIALEK